MARPFLAAGAALWGAAGLAGIAAAFACAELIASLLPELVIDAAAIARTTAALATGALLVAVAHAAVAIGLGRGGSWALSAGVLLAAPLAVGWIATGAALLTSGAAGTIPAALAAGGAALCAALGVGYGAVAALLARRLRGSGAVS